MMRIYSVLLRMAMINSVLLGGRGRDRDRDVETECIFEGGKD